MSNAFMALIWWVIPLAGLIGALGYVLWVTQFKSKFESETSRSVGQFQRFQDSFRDAQVTIASEEPVKVDPVEVDPVEVDPVQPPVER